MDRLQAVAVAAAALAAGLLVAAGCGGEGTGGSGGLSGVTTVPAGRVNAVTAAPKDPAKLAEGFCDARPKTPEAALTFALPETTGDAPAGAVAGTWRWVNVWATWCKPCIAEMPMLAKWKERLAGEGVKLDLTFLSVDSDDATVAEHRKSHPDTPRTARLKDTAALPKFVESVGLDPGAPIPVHVFVDPANKIRCVRAGGLGESDYDAVKSVLSGA